MAPATRAQPSPPARVSLRVSLRVDPRAIRERIGFGASPHGSHPETRVWVREPRTMGSIPIRKGITGGRQRITGSRPAASRDRRG
jgi:hypothetical protein